MENTLRSVHHPKFLVMPALLVVIYAFGTVIFILLWLGKQVVPGFEGFEGYGLVYAILCLLGAISNAAILQGYRWGVIGQIGMWAANWVVNVVLHRAIDLSIGIALLIVTLWAFEVYRSRQSAS